MLKKALETGEFAKWFDGLRDKKAKQAVFRRMRRLMRGHYGDTRFIGDGCFELRIHYGPGYRIYFKDTGNELIILLAGGDKGSQKRDIGRALELAQKYGG